MSWEEVRPAPHAWGLYRFCFSNYCQWRLTVVCIVLSFPLLIDFPWDNGWRVQNVFDKKSKYWTSEPTLQSFDIRVLGLCCKKVSFYEEDEEESVGLDKAGWCYFRWEKMEKMAVFKWLQLMWDRVAFSKPRKCDFRISPSSPFINCQRSTVVESLSVSLFLFWTETRAPR